MHIAVSHQGQAIDSLSGGNQQKAVIARWLTEEADLYILDEPTKGVDVGAKEEIYKLMVEFVQAGKCVIMISSDLPEILGMSDRIIVIHDGRICGRLNGREATEEKVMACATGHAVMNETDPA